ncbi:MAG: lipid-A-disaccharide synthase [Bacteroidales bacterium]
MRYYLVAGEASGDLHGSNLIKGLKSIDKEAEFRCWGGDLMASEGAVLVKHYKESAIMGFVEVLTHIKKIAYNLKECKKDIKEYNPNVLILIDYPGFNFRIAEFAKQNKIKVFYYIAPKVWAWKENRVNKLRMFTDRVFIIFPFEVDYFKKKGINAIYKGNPLLDSVDNYKYNAESRNDFCKRVNISPDKPIIALLAGSRKGEISYLLPRMICVAKRFDEYRFILAGAPSIEKNYYTSFLEKSNSKIELLSGETYSILRHAKAAIISSGTASLEAALLKVPQVVCYGGNEITYQIAKKLVKLKYISLANLIMNKGIFKELIQHKCTPNNIAAELQLLLNDNVYREKMLKDFNDVREILGGKGASDKVAAAMLEELGKM